MKDLKIFCLLLTFSFTVRAQSPYAVNLISKDLISRASSVVRTMEMNIEVKELNNVSYKFKKAITVLNKNGDDEAGIYLWYNKSRQIKFIKGIIYDEFGKPTWKIAEKDFKDISAASDYALFEDSRMKIFSPAVTTYPYTLEYEYEIRSKQTLVFPDWYPNNSIGVSVEHAALHFTCKPDFKIRYKEMNYAGKMETVANADQTTTYTWEAKNLKALRNEPYSPNNDDFKTSVKIAPEKFEYLGINGSFTNWDEMGKWINDKLLKGRNTIPTETASLIESLTKDITDPKQKAKKIYEYMQQKTRYVSIQVGIGGFQPISASEVDRTSYGDCKGLANYTQGLLNLVGIKSYYAIVASGNLKQNALPDFASMTQFDHVILCIPFKNDTTWIDCTNKENPFGYIGDFTDDRLALVCTENGGKLIRTTKFDQTKSLQSRKANFIISDNGDMIGDMVTTFRGSQYDNRDMLIKEPYTEQLKKLPEIYSIDNMDIELFQLKQDKEANPVTTETIKFKARNYGSINDKQLYIPINMVNRQSSVREVRNRINPVYINRGYVDVDEIVYTLPEKFKIDNAPQNFTIEHPFGKYSTTFEVKGNVLKYTRKMQLNEGTYSAEKYEDLVSFFQSATDADNQKIALVKE